MRGRIAAWGMSPPPRGVPRWPQTAQHTHHQVHHLLQDRVAAAPRHTAYTATVSSVDTDGIVVLW